MPDIPNLVQLCESFGVSADYLVREEADKDSEKNPQNTKNLARLTREREKTRYQARYFYYTAFAFFIMAFAFALAFLIDSKWVCFDISMGQFVSAGILWIFYSRAVKKIEQMNLEMEDLT